jgi:hypothetical protein
MCYVRTDTSFERVRTLLKGGTPDRPPLYDVIRNDAVLPGNQLDSCHPHGSNTILARLTYISLHMPSAGIKLFKLTGIALLTLCYRYITPKSRDGP